MRQRDTDTGRLDPRLDAERWERVVARIRSAAEPELERLATRRSAFGLLVEHSRPILAAAALVAGLATAAIFGLGDGDGTAPTGTAIADAIAPSPVATWLVTGQAPTMEEVVTATEGGT